MRGAKREERFAGGAVPNFFRKPYGPGWALVGDAGYNKDPITAQGISDAFRDAERAPPRSTRCSRASRSFDDAMADYHQARDEHAMPIYEFTTQLATLEPPPPEMQQLLVRRESDRGGHGRVREHRRRDDVADRVLRSRAHRADHGRGGSASSLSVSTTLVPMLKWPRPSYILSVALGTISTVWGANAG